MSIVAYIDGKTEEIRARRKRRCKEHAEWMAALAAGEVVNPEGNARIAKWNKRTAEANARLFEFEAAVKAWYERLCEAKARGETFDEPLPTVRGD